MVLYNRYKIRQQKKQKMKKSLDNPVVEDVGGASFNKHSVDYLMKLKKELEGREAQVANMALKRRLLEGQMKANYEIELNRLKGEMHNPRIPETSLEHLKKRSEVLEKLSEAIF